MRRLATLCAATVVLAATFAAPARAAVSPTGTLCGLVSVADPQYPPGYRSGVVMGGPLVLADDTYPATYAGALTCTVQANAGNHVGGDSCSVSGPTTGSAVVVAGTCTYAADTNDNVYVCTQLDIVGGPTLYHDGSDSLFPGGWSTDPDTPCALATPASAGCGSSEYPCDGLSLIVCPPLRILFPRGDIPGVVGCGPYSEWFLGTHVIFLNPGVT